MKQVSVSSMIPDHAIISITVSLQKPQVPVKTLRYRKYHSVDTKELEADLMESALITDSINNLDQLIKLYDITIQNLIDKHAPVQSKELSCHSTNPWYSRDIQAAKRYHHYCECLVKRTKLTVHHEMFVAAITQVRELISTAKAQYYNNKIVECNGSQKTVFTVVNKVLHRDDMILPTTFKSDEDMAQGFNNFFQSKIKRIRQDLESSGEKEKTVFIGSDQSYVSIIESFAPFTESETDSQVI